jgi:hypothetical protein
MQAIRRAAELAQITESLRAKMIRGEAVDVSAVLRYEGVAARALAHMRQLAREVRAEAQAHPQTLNDAIAAAEGHRVRSTLVRGPTTSKPAKFTGEASKARQASHKRGGGTP